MMNSLRLSAFLRVAVLGCAFLGQAALYAASAASDAFLGRWALTLPNAAGWLEVKKENGWIDGSLLWGGGRVLPVAHV
ncbi:MAG TPA: hypothetical protein VGE76_00730, partial [Opitutaceae bacterium]